MKYLLPSTVTAVATAVFLKLTNAPETRAGRWCKLLISVPLVFYIMTLVSKGFGWGGGEMSFDDGMTAIALMIFLSFFWALTISHHTSNKATAIIFGGTGTLSAGHIPDYKYAREKALEGDFKEAIKLCQWELSKQPDNYEGLLLLATIHMEMKQPKLALEQVELILKIPHLGEKQEREARRAKLECLNAIH